MSHTQTRAEGLGFYVTVGMATCAAHIICLGVATLVFGSGSGGYMLLQILTFLTRTAWITVVQRIAFVYKTSSNEHPIPRITVPGPSADSVGKGI